MYNFYDRLKQKKALVSLPTEVTDGYKEDMTETAEEINEAIVSMPFSGSNLNCASIL